MRFLRKTIRQHYKLASIFKAQDTKDVTAKLYSGLPDIICIRQLLPVLSRDDVQILNELKHPSNLLSLLILKAVNKLLNRTTAICSPEKLNFFHSP